MPLKDIRKPQYLRKERIFIDTIENRLSEPSNVFNPHISLNQLYEKIASIELSRYVLPRDIAPTFLQTNSGYNGNNVVDVYIENAAATSNLSFTVEIPEQRYSETDDIATDLSTVFTAALNATPTSIFNLASPNNSYITVEFWGGGGINDDEEAYLLFKHQENAGAGTVDTTYRVQFLFQSGANSENAAFRPLGFSQVDTVIDVANSIIYPRSTQRINYRPYRYVDVTVAEAQELKPVHRIFMGERNYFYRDGRIRSAPRLLTTPIRNMRSIHIMLRLAGGINPADLQSAGYDFVFDLLLNSPEIDVPSWVRQSLKY